MKEESKALALSQSNVPAMPSADILTAIASLPKRDEDQCAANLKTVATSSFEMAVSCLWCVPVGREKGQQRQKFRLGESARFAELAKNQFGMFTTMGLKVDRDYTVGKESVTVSLTEWDLSKINSEPGMATVRVYGERWDLAEANALSKARRNAILALLKPYTLSIVSDIKKAIVAHHGANTKDAFAAIAQEFKDSWNVGIDELKDIVSGEKTTDDKIVLAYGLKNFIMDNGDKGFSDVFGREKSKVAPTTSSSGKKANQPSQTPKQRFASFQAVAAQKLSEDELNIILKGVCEKTGVSMTKWGNKEYEAASNALANAIDVKDSE